jgi:hypothetical protein
MGRKASYGGHEITLSQILAMVSNIIIFKNEIHSSIESFQFNQYMYEEEHKEIGDLD